MVLKKKVSKEVLVIPLPELKIAVESGDEELELCSFDSLSEERFVAIALEAGCTSREAYTLWFSL